LLLLSVEECAFQSRIALSVKMHGVARLLCAAFFAAFAARCASIACASAALFSYHSCASVKAAPADAKCADLSVFENRATRSGRRINIGVVVLPAKEHNTNAIFAISGGPGQSAIDDIPQYTIGPMAPLRRSHDIIFAAQRGTAHSNQLQCPLYDNPAIFFRELFPHVALAKCRNDLAARADLDQYGTSVAADDLDDVRAALGYRQIELFGGSYGTEASQVYARRHPSRVRAMLLESVATTNFLVPLPYERGSQRALDELVAACASQPKCHQAFPALRAHFEELLRRFDARPLQVTLKVSRTPRQLALSRAVFVDRLRQLLYDPFVARAVPLIIEDAHRGNTKPLATAIFALTQSLANALSWGMGMSVNCSEDDPFITPTAIAAASRGTFTRSDRLDAQHQACLIWHVRPVDRSYLLPVRSSAPILMLSGMDDPATPQEYARRQLRYYPNGRLISIPHGGHNNESRCLDRIRITFLEGADSKAVDARCISASARPAFMLTDKELNALF